MGSRRRGSEIEMEMTDGGAEEQEQGITVRTGRGGKPKPPFKPAEDDTKPVLRDPILRSDPIETEEVFLRLPPFPLVVPPATASGGRSQLPRY